MEFLSLKGGCAGSSKSINGKIPLCWKSYAMANLLILNISNSGCEKAAFQEWRTYSEKLVLGKYTEQQKKRIFGIVYKLGFGY